MQKLKSEFLNILNERGLFNQCSDLEGLDTLLSSGKPVAGYWGCDPTADSLHIGNLASLTLLRLFQKTGNKPIALAGGATGRLGDPSGRDSERTIMTDETFAKNMAGVKRSMEKIFTFGTGETDAIMIDNYEWFKNVGYIDFITKYGRHFSVNEMVKRDSVKMRLDREQSLSFLEFNYSLLQAYDFVEINKRYGAVLQFGGSDQWGNIVSGVDLGRKLGIQLYALTNPLLIDANGVKYGKSMGNAVWLNEDKLPAYDYYQFLRNVDDRDVSKLLRIFTELSITEIEKLEKLQGAEINEAKKILAFEATKICRGSEEAKSAEATAKETFENGGMGAGLPTFDIKRAENILDVLVATDLCKSKGMARIMIDSSAVSLSDKKLTEDDRAKSIAELIGSAGGKHLLTCGKKSRVILNIID